MESIFFIFLSLHILTIVIINKHSLIGSIFCAVLITSRICLSDVTYLHPTTISNNDHNDMDLVQNEMSTSANKYDAPDMESNQINSNKDENDKEIKDEEKVDCSELQYFSDKSDHVVLLQSEEDDMKEDHKSDLDHNNEEVDGNSFQLQPRQSQGNLKETLGRTFPIWGIVLILMLTRVNQIGFKKYLTQTEPYIEIKFRTYGEKGK